MTELILFGVIGILALLLVYEKHQSKQERNKLLNTLISRNSEELRNIELVEKAKPEKEKKRPADDLIPESELDDEAFMKSIKHG